MTSFITGLLVWGIAIYALNPWKVLEENSNNTSFQTNIILLVVILLSIFGIFMGTYAIRKEASSKAIAIIGMVLNGAFFSFCVIGLLIALFGSV